MGRINMSFVSLIQFKAKKTISILSSILILLCLNPNDIYSDQSVLLKTGRTIKGTILDQTEKILTIKLENGTTESIDKSTILKVVYIELTPDEERKIRFNEEKNRKFDNTTPNSETQIMLFTVQGKNCIPYASQTEWFWLYGNLPLSTVNWSTILPKEKKLIQILWNSNWKDTLITIFLGGLTSISRKTLAIEICELESDSKKTINKK